MCSAPSSAPGKAEWFATTHWSVVLASGHQESPQAVDALGTLCRTYWYPLYAFVRRQGYNAEDAQDLTQEFFSRVIRKNYFRDANPGRGKFRGFLQASLKHFLANEWDKAHAAKRGGRTVCIPFDERWAESQFAFEPAEGRSPEVIYERTWALTLLEHVRQRLREEFDAAGQIQRFDMLERFLPGERTELTYAEAGLRLGLTEGAVKSEVHRLRKRYRARLRTEIAHTVASPEEIAEEIRHLIAVVSG